MMGCLAVSTSMLTTSRLLKPELDKAFDRSYVINTINIPANALTDWSGTSFFGKPEFTFNRKNRELHTREQHTIKVFSPGFDEVLDDFANSHFHY